MSNQSAPRRGQTVELSCPHCGKKVGVFAGGQYNYGSPIKICPKCGKEYVNSFFHEIEIDGINPDAFDMKRLIIGIILGIVIFAVSAGIHYFEVTVQRYYHYAFIGMMIISAMVFVFCIANIILIKTGLKAKRTEKMRRESAARLANPDYARKLAEHGYNVPEKYLKNVNTADFTDNK